MGQALYRKHRPKSLDEVVGQEHITQTLGQAIKQGRISHAYLFTGPRGVGKTSVARILAHQINGLPYTDDSSHIDIIEIDAASNRRIDEIRELRDKVYVVPTSAKYKVYIIDEVHMLTREAFNALLKTLEEPPEHVVFILATTDVHKLPETIISRTQRFSFRPGETAKVAEHLKQIAKTEKLDISDEALQMMAEHGEGSFRDSVSLLDQAGSQSSQVGTAEVERLLGTPSATALEQLLAMISIASAPPALMQHLSAMYNQGYQAAEIAKRLGQTLRRRLSDSKLDMPMTEALSLLGRLVEVPASRDPEQALEIALLQALPTGAAAVTTEPSIEKTAEPAIRKAKASETKQLDAELWPEVLKALKQQHNTLYSVVRMAQPDFSDTSTLKLAFAFSFHQKRLDENSNRQKLVDIIYNLSGQTLNIENILDKAAKPPNITLPSKSDPESEPEKETSEEAKQPNVNDLSAISNIFGKAELLES